MSTIENVLVTRRYLITGAKRASNYWWAFIVSFGGFAFFITGFASFLQQSLFFFNPSKSISFFPQGLSMCFYGCLGLLFGFYLWCTIFWKVGDGFNEFNKNKGFVRIFRWGLPGKNRRIDFRYKMDEIEGVRVELKEGINPRRVISLKMSVLSTKPDSEGMRSSSFKSNAAALPKNIAKNSNQGSVLRSERFVSAMIDKRPSFIEKEKAFVLPEESMTKQGFVQAFAWSSSTKNDKSFSFAGTSSNNSRENRGQRESFTIPLTRVGQPISLEKIESQASELAQFLRVSLETSYLDS